MTLSIQIIGASREHARVSHFAERVRGIPGVDIRFAWYIGASEWTGRDASTDDSTAAVVAGLNEAAIKGADLVIHLAPAQPSHGAAWEYGYALALHKPVWSVGQHNRDTIYRAHRLVTLVPTDDAALTLLAASAAARLAVTP